jgi:hypothetical protein
MTSTSPRYRLLVSLLKNGRAPGDIPITLMFDVASEGHDLAAIFSRYEQ